MGIFYNEYTFSSNYAKPYNILLRRNCRWNIFLNIQIWRALNIVLDFVGFRVKKSDNKVEVEVSFRFKLYVSINRFKTDVITLCPMCKPCLIYINLKTFTLKVTLFLH